MYVIATTDDTETAPYTGSRKTTLDVLARLDWTTEPPTQEGWYWIIANVSGYDARVIVHFPYENKQGIEKITHWLGPLPMPELPDIS